ncbi:hypothetical protein [Actinomadura logoneensis]|uniref:hypothetical protein n=1 Tax=Actinomadura logoneensis TaxID=2293572 RepID=UPI0013148B88|nr:hypothetical protein [Actinomadura logoneensis]
MAQTAVNNDTTRTSSGGTATSGGNGPGGGMYGKGLPHGGEPMRDGKGGKK